MLPRATISPSFATQTRGFFAHNLYLKSVDISLATANNAQCPRSISTRQTTLGFLISVSPSRQPDIVALQKALFLIIKHIVNPPRRRRDPRLDRSRRRELDQGRGRARAPRRARPAPQRVPDPQPRRRRRCRAGKPHDASEHLRPFDALAADGPATVWHAVAQVAPARVQQHMEREWPLRRDTCGEARGCTRRAAGSFSAFWNRRC